MTCMRYVCRYSQPDTEQCLSDNGSDRKPCHVIGSRNKYSLEDSTGIVIHLHIHTRTHTHRQIQLQTQAHMQTQTQTHTHRYIYIYIYSHRHTHAHTHTHTHAQSLVQTLIHTHVRTYTHTHSRSLSLSLLHTYAHTHMLSHACMHACRNLYVRSYRIIHTRMHAAYLLCSLSFTPSYIAYLHACKRDPLSIYLLICFLVFFHLSLYVWCSAARPPLPPPHGMPPPPPPHPVVPCGVGSPVPLRPVVASAAPPSMAIAGWASGC